jgi:hypothetical protein
MIKQIAVKQKSLPSTLYIFQAPGNNLKCAKWIASLKSRSQDISRQSTIRMSARQLRLETGVVVLLTAIDN